MKIDKTLNDEYAVLTLKGEFDTFYCPALMQEVEDLLEKGVNHLVLDMRLVKFINSTALGAVIKAHKRSRAEGGELVIAQPSMFVRDVITKVGIDKLIALHDSEEQAIKAIIKHLNQKELTGDAPVDQEKVLITFTDDVRNQMIGGKKALLGTMSNVDGHKVQFVWNGTKSGISGDQAKQLFYRQQRGAPEVPGQDDQEELLRAVGDRRPQRAGQRRRRADHREVHQDLRPRPQRAEPVRGRHGVLEAAVARQVAPGK
jgi:anti-anti-sigma factor